MVPPLVLFNNSVRFEGHVILLLRINRKLLISLDLFDECLLREHLSKLSVTKYPLYKPHHPYYTN